MVYGRRKFITAHTTAAIAIRMKMPSRIFVYRSNPIPPSRPPSLTACEPFTKCSSLIETLAEARDAGVSITARCGWGQAFLIRNGNVSCPLRVILDMPRRKS
jgi:hypothetical protein